MMTRSFLISASVTLVCFSSAAQDPSFYRKQDTWQHTLQASLETLYAQGSGVGTASLVTLGPWTSIGPFKAKTKDAFAEVFPPETEYAPAKAYEGGSLRWTNRPGWHDGTVVLFEQTDFCAMYLSRSISATNDTILALSLGSDDGIKVWFDGRLVLQHDISRGVQPGQEALELRVPRGEHRLLLKINNGQGDFGFYFAVVDREMKELLRLIGRDFPSSTVKEEIGWESADSIWGSRWTPGDEAELARRYAAATLFDTPSERDAAMSNARWVSSAAALDSVRKVYLDARRRDITPVVLTPPASPAPRINGARVFGVRPGNPFLYTVAATGTRPIMFSAEGLPKGLSIDSVTGRITGTLAAGGTFRVTLQAENRLGSSKRVLRIVSGNQIALTPPLGWNSWNCFASAVDDSKVRAAADAMASSGLINHGWTYINIDDCWEVKPGSGDPMLSGEPRTPDGRINTNRKFPDMKKLADYVHSRGLKMGIYSSPGPLTCAGFTASYGFETQDASQYAVWGIDYLKYDWCSYGSVEKGTTREALQKPYRVMRRALDGVHRDIVFSLCQYGMGKVWEWGGEVGGNCWRTTGDIEDSWESMSGIGFSQAGHEKYAKPGNWNDPDMLVVGKVGWGPELHPTRLTPNEQVTHITLWSLLDAPLLIGCDMTQLDEFTYSLLSNDEVLEVNQDPLGAQASRIKQNGECEVWAKDLEDGSKAVGLFNRGRWRSQITLTWADLGLQGPHFVRDLWRQKDLGEHQEGITLPVPRHGALLLRVAVPS
jgi:alpha-galactosidase